MAKIKLNLPTGGVEEKLLLNAFKADNNSYIVFDAENVGSMGLPIILVCKYENDRVTKITDAEEWTKVKGYLKEIISGNNKEYINLSDTLNGDEIYFTQLTLPVASFDALKAAYVPAAVQPENLVADSSDVNNIEPNLTGVSNINESLGQPNFVVPVGEPVVDTDATAMANPILGDLPSLSSNAEEKEPIPEAVVNDIPNIPNLQNINNVEPNLVDVSSVNESLGQPNLVVPTGEPVIDSNVANMTNPILGDLPSLNADTEVKEPVSVGLDSNVLPPDALVVPSQNDSNDGVNIVPNLEDEPVNMNVDSSLLNSVEGSNGSLPIDFAKEKEEFLASCSSLFDSWVEKLQNKIK